MVILPAGARVKTGAHWNGDPMTGTIFNIKKYAIHDGPGIRTTIFLKGCLLACPWCHNPEGMRREPECPGKTLSRSGGGRAVKTGIMGREVDVAAVMADIEKDRIFYDESGGGVTFSGGEPLFQAAFLKALLTACREREIHTAVDTSGYALPEVFSEILAAADLFLYDLKVMDPARHLDLTGVSNRWILENLKTLAASGKPTVLRFPVIPGMTDAPENIASVAAFVRDLKTIREVSILPYHRTAEGKYRKLGVAEKMTGIETPGPAEIERIKGQFESTGFTVTVGG